MQTSVVFPLFFQDPKMIPFNVIGSWETLSLDKNLVYSEFIPNPPLEMKNFVYKPFYYIRLNSFLQLNYPALNDILIPVFILTKQDFYFGQLLPESIPVQAEGEFHDGQLVP